MSYMKVVRAPRLLIALTLTLTLVSFTPAPRARAAASDLDLSFGNGGKVVTDISMNFDEAHGVAVQADGKIVAAGFAQPTDFASRDFALVRYNADGSLDATFGSGGKVTTDFGSFDAAETVAIQSDGKIIAAGTGGVNFEFALARYNPNGSLDTSFGVGGKVTTTTGIGGDVFALTIQPDGKIIAVGVTTSVGTDRDMAMARYNPNGSLDTSFGVSGIVITDFFGGADFATAVALRPDGKIVVAGFAQATPTPFSYDFALARYQTNGSLDSSFGTNGKVTTEIVSDGEDEANSLVIQPDGKLVVAGFTQTNVFSDIALARYNADGALDNTFGAGGIVVTHLSSNSAARALLLQPNGKLIVGGFVSSANGDFVLVRYNSNGSLDGSFGSGGVVATDFDNGGDEALALAMQPDGKIVAAGFSERPPFSPPFAFRDFALARYNGDGSGSFDICLQDDGNGNLLQINSTTGEYAFSNCRKGVTFRGVGTVRVRGCKLELQSVAANQQLSALVNTCSHVATASLKLASTPKPLTIADGDITNNTCSCR